MKFILDVNVGEAYARGLQKKDTMCVRYEKETVE